MVWRALCVGCGVVNPYCADTLVKRLSINLRITAQKPESVYNRFRYVVSRISPNSDRELARVRRPPRPHTYLSGCILPMYLLSWFCYLRMGCSQHRSSRFWKLFDAREAKLTKNSKFQNPYTVSRLAELTAATRTHLKEHRLQAAVIDCWISDRDHVLVLHLDPSRGLRLACIQ